MSIRPALVNCILSARDSHPSVHGWRWHQLLVAVVGIAELVLLFKLFPDVCSPYKFTHAADAMARMVVQNALFW